MSRCGPPSVQTEALATSGRGLCAVGLLALLLLAVWSCWRSDDYDVYGAPLQGANVAGAPAAAQEPAAAAAERLFQEPRPGLGAPVGVSGAFAGTGGSALDSGTYEVSEDSSEYYKHFKPMALEKTMPLGWRGEGAEKCGSEEVYREFGRYAVTPVQMKKAEGLRSVLRLSENSRDGLARTLGQRSLQRDFVTPLGPSPIGDAAMLFNDSSVRQNYIASATGRFPELSKSC